MSWSSSYSNDNFVSSPKILFNIDSVKKLLYLKYDSVTETIYITALNHVFACPLNQSERKNCRIILRDLVSARGLYLDLQSRNLFVVDHRSKKVHSIKLKNGPSQNKEDSVFENLPVSTLLSSQILEDVGDIFHLCILNTIDSSFLIWSEFRGKIKMTSLNDLSSSKVIFLTKEHTYSITLMNNSTTSFYSKSKFSNKPTPSLISSRIRNKPIEISISETNHGKFTIIPFIKNEIKKATSQMIENKHSSDFAFNESSTQINDLLSKSNLSDSAEISPIPRSTNVSTSIKITSPIYEPSSTTTAVNAIADFTTTPNGVSLSLIESPDSLIDPEIIQSIENIETKEKSDLSYEINEIVEEKNPDTFTFTLNKEDKYDDNYAEKNKKENSELGKEFEFNNLIKKEVLKTTTKNVMEETKSFFYKSLHQQTDSSVELLKNELSADLSIKKIIGKNLLIQNKTVETHPATKNTYSYLKSQSQLHISVYIVIGLLCFSLVINIILLYVIKMKPLRNGKLIITHEICEKLETAPSQRSMFTTKNSNSGAEIPDCNINLINSNESAIVVDSDH